MPPRVVTSRFVALSRSGQHVRCLIGDVLEDLDVLEGGRMMSFCRGSLEAREQFEIDCHTLLSSSRKI